MAELSQQWATLTDRLKQLAPKLAPQPLPRKMRSSAGFEALRPLCANQACRKELQQFATRIETCDNKVVSWHGTVNLATKTYSISSAKLMSADEAAVRDINSLLQLQANGDVARSKHLVELFLERNNHAATKIMAAQECISVAYALQVILRNMQNLSITVGGVKAPFRSDESLRTALAALFPAATSASKRAGGVAEHRKAKKQKKKHKKSKK